MDLTLLAAAAVVLVLLVLPWVLYARQRGRVTSLRRAAARMSPGAPLGRDHDHVWTDQQVARIGHWRRYACTVPGCDALDDRSGKA